ncbi:MAG: hypothetical protein J5826_06250, partial [Bacteroidales bacterium]|nr:hypothetical protein [Bacteroidales bacterium]
DDCRKPHRRKGHDGKGCCKSYKPKQRVTQEDVNFTSQPCKYQKCVKFHYYEMFLQDGNLSDF